MASVRLIMGKTFNSDSHRGKINYDFLTLRQLMPASIKVSTMATGRSTSREKNAVFFYRGKGDGIHRFSQDL
jgi:hypothetical protein